MGRDTYSCCIYLRSTNKYDAIIIIFNHANVSSYRLLLSFSHRTCSRWQIYFCTELLMLECCVCVSERRE